MDDNDAEKRITELERQLADAQDQAHQASNFGPPPPAGLPQGSQPHPGAAPQSQVYPSAGQAPQPFPPPPSANNGPPFGGELRSWSGTSPSTGWQGGAPFGRTRRRSRHLLWVLVVPLVLLWPIVKHPVLQFVQRTVDHENTSRQATTSQPAEPKACDLLTPDIITPVLGADATVTFNVQGTCAYQSARGHGSAHIGDWSTMEPSGSNQQVSGLGDEAVFSASDLYVRKGSVGLEVELSESPFLGGGATLHEAEARQADAEKAIAQQLLPKL